MRDLHLYTKTVSCFFAASVLILAESALAASTQWEDIGGGRARMLANLSPETGKISGALEIDLLDGWKTYWRTPGDSGIPPLLDFTASQGFFPGEIRLPAPVHVTGPDLSFVGYKKHVTFLFDGDLAGTGPAANITLNVLLGVCEDICIPAQASFVIPAADLNRSDPETDLFLEQASTYLPQQPAEDFHIEAVSKAADQHLEISVKVPDPELEYSLFAEGPADWYLTPARFLGVEKGRAKFNLDLNGLPEGADTGATKLRYTIVSPGASIEEWRSAD